MPQLDLALATSQIETDEAVSIFDLDRTLHSGSGLAVLAKHGFRRRLVRGHKLAYSLMHEFVYRQRGSTDQQTSSVAELALGVVNGITVEDMMMVIDSAAQEIAASVRPAMRILLESHQKAGHQTVILSASPQELVQAIAGLLRVDHGIGTQIEQEDGVLTGQIVAPMCYGAEKLDRLHAVMGWTSEDLSMATSYAYADSISDLPLLESVDTPVAVSPDRELLRIALDRGWPVLQL